MVQGRNCRDNPNGYLSRRILKCLFNITIILLRQAAFDCSNVMAICKWNENASKHRSAFISSTLYMASVAYLHTKGGGNAQPIGIFFYTHWYRMINTIKKIFWYIYNLHNIILNFLMEALPLKISAYATDILYCRNVSCENKNDYTTL